jgi:hypothetical protein
MGTKGIWTVRLVRGYTTGYRRGRDRREREVDEQGRKGKRIGKVLFPSSLASSS